MLELRPNCECCDVDLPPDSGDARIFTFECTFCVTCAEQTLRGICPNCGGDFVRRPIRPAGKLLKFPASTIRKLKAGGCAALGLLLAIGLGACNEGTGARPTMTASTATNQGGVAGGFEIVYRGASTRFQADNRACPSPGLVVIRPENDAFTYRLGGRILIEATIIGDGSLAGAGQDYTITGTATAEKIEGDIQNGQCGYHFRAMRKH